MGTSLTGSVRDKRLMAVGQKKKAAQQGKTPSMQQSSQPLLEEDCGVESSVFDASTAYTASDLANLLQSSGSVLSLTLSHTADGKIDAVWVPETEESVPLRSATVQIRPSLPRTSTYNLGLFEPTATWVSRPKVDRASFIRKMNTKRRMWSEALVPDPFGFVATMELVSSHFPDGLFEDNKYFSVSFTTTCYNYCCQLCERVQFSPDGGRLGSPFQS